MNIILLSGGSGKRLWPLSNDIRSKQFLKLLKNEEGDFESMVQRVYRQIKTVCPNSNIVVATSTNQVEALSSQLGDGVDLVIEPERRDTFPAIALAASYLAFEKKINYNEVVLVLPVDPYADMGYFYTLLQMEEAVYKNTAEMVLMGIQPTYPSEKYGYILPDYEKETTDLMVGRVLPVKKFLEKPTEKVAEQLIEQGAVWNAGIFGFKLGYLMDTITKYMEFTSYQQVQDNYSNLKKISFDYAVVEEARSVAMVPYAGDWKDLGTWNTLSEEMDDDYMGYVAVGEDTTGTNIINELSIPVVVLGVKDLIVAASPDGILISDKQKSSYLKSYVDKIDLRPMFEERRWGDYKVLDYKTYENGKKTLTRNIHVKAGCSLGSHSHQAREEIWTVIDGMGTFELEGHSRNIQAGDVMYIHKGQIHNLVAYTDINLIEVQISRDLS